MNVRGFAEFENVTSAYEKEHAGGVGGWFGSAWFWNWNGLSFVPFMCGN